MSFKLANLLTEEDLIPEEVLESIFARRQKEGNTGFSFDSDICREGLMEPLELTPLLGEALGLPPVSKNTIKALPERFSQLLELREKWPIEWVETHEVLAIGESEGVLQLVSALPISRKRVKQIKEAVGLECSISPIPQLYYVQLAHAVYEQAIPEVLLEWVAKWPLEWPSNVEDPSDAESAVESEVEPEAQQAGSETQEADSLVGEADEDSSAQEATAEANPEVSEDASNELSDEASASAQEMAEASNVDTQESSEEQSTETEAVEQQELDTTDTASAVDEASSLETQVAEEQTIEESEVHEIEVQEENELSSASVEETENANTAEEANISEEASAAVESTEDLPRSEDTEQSEDIEQAEHTETSEADSVQSEDSVHVQEAVVEEQVEEGKETKAENEDSTEAEVQTEEAAPENEELAAVAESDDTSESTEDGSVDAEASEEPSDSKPKKNLMDNVLGAPDDMLDALFDSMGSMDGLPAFPPLPQIKKEEPAAEEPEESEDKSIQEVITPGASLSSLDSMMGGLGAPDLDAVLGTSSFDPALELGLPSTSSTAEETDAESTVESSSESENVQEEALVSAEEPVSETEEDTAPEEESKPVPLSIQDIDFLLERAQSRDSVLELGLFFTAGVANQAAVFMLPRGQAVGRYLHGAESLQSVFRTFSIPIHGDTIFRKIRDSLVPYSGPIPSTKEDRFFFALFDPPPQTVYFFPVRLRGRNIAALYCHQYVEELDTDVYEQLMRCAHLVASALERVIIALKKGTAEDESSDMEEILQALRNNDAATYEAKVAPWRPEPIEEPEDELEDDDDDFMFEEPVMLAAQKSEPEPEEDELLVSEPVLVQSFVEEPTETASDEALHSDAGDSDRKAASQTEEDSEPEEDSYAEKSQSEHHVEVVSQGSGLAFTSETSLDELPTMASEAAPQEGTLDFLPAANQPATIAYDASTEEELTPEPPVAVGSEEATPDATEAEVPPASEASPEVEATSSIETKRSEDEARDQEIEEMLQNAPSGWESTDDEEHEELQLEKQSVDMTETLAEMPPFELPNVQDVESAYSEDEFEETVTVGMETSDSLSTVLNSDIGDAEEAETAALADTSDTPQKVQLLAPPGEAPSLTQGHMSIIRSANGSVWGAEVISAHTHRDGAQFSSSPSLRDAPFVDALNLQNEHYFDGDLIAHTTSLVIKQTIEGAFDWGRKEKKGSPPPPPKPVKKPKPVSATAEVSDTLGEPEPHSPSELEQEVSSEHSVEADAVWQEALTVPTLRYSLPLAEDATPFSELPPLSEALSALVDELLEPEQHEAALARLLKLPVHQLIATLLIAFPGQIERNQVQSDGSLSFECMEEPSGRVWNILLDYPTETLPGLLRNLAFGSRNERIMTLLMLRQIPCGPIVPYLVRMLGEQDPVIVKLVRKLLFLNRRTPELSGTLEWLREQVNDLQPERALQATQLLVEARDAHIVPVWIELLDSKVKGFPDRMQQALVHVTRQNISTSARRWRKWWKKVGVHTERMDWLIEGIQQKDLKVAEAAIYDLRELTGLEFGFNAGDAKKKRQASIQQWKAWHKNHA